MCRAAWKREPGGGQCGQGRTWCCGRQLGTKGPLVRLPLVLALICSPVKPGVMRNVTTPIRTSPSGATSTACTARAAAAEMGCASMCFLRKYAVTVTPDCAVISHAALPHAVCSCSSGCCGRSAAACRPAGRWVEAAEPYQDCRSSSRSFCERVKAGLLSSPRPPEPSQSSSCNRGYQGFTAVPSGIQTAALEAVQHLDSSALSVAARLYVVPDVMCRRACTAEPGPRTDLHVAQLALHVWRPVVT